MGALGGLYRPTPRGTKVICRGVGPSCQCLWSPASPPAAGARRLVGPAGCRALCRQVGPTTCGPCQLLITIALPPMTMAWSGRAWLQYRRLVGVHSSHTPSYLVNDAQTSREGRLLGAALPPMPTGLGMPSSGISLAGRARRLRAVPTTRHGIMAAVPWMMS